MEMKNIFVKIPKQVWKIIKDNGHSCTQLAKVYLTKYAEKIVNEPLIIELKPKQEEINAISKPSDIYPNSDAFNKRKAELEQMVKEGKEIDEEMEDLEDYNEEAEHSHNVLTHPVPKDTSKDDFWDKIANEQKEKFGPKLTKKEKERLEQEELGKKFGKDPSKYTFEEVTPASLAKDGWTKEQIDAYMKNRNK
jgi:hypothetical protein